MLANENQIRLIESLSFVELTSLIPTLEEGLKVDRLTLQANELINDSVACRQIRSRITDAEVLLCFLYIRTIDRQT